jgi:hypothetical protein
MNPSTEDILRAFENLQLFFSGRPLRDRVV